MHALSSDLLDLRGVGQRAVAFRFDLLDNTNATIGELHPVAGDLTPTVTCDSTRAVVCDMANLNLIPSEAAAVDPLNNRVMPHMLVEDGTEEPLGLFVWADYSFTRYSYGLPSVSSLVDQGIALNQPTSVTTSFATSTSVRTALLRVLAGAFVVGLVDSTPAVLAAPLAWPAGTLRSQILNDLCVIGGYLPPYFNHNGQCLIQVAPDPANLPDPVVTFAAGGNIYAGLPIENNDLLTAPNRYIVVSNSAGAGEIVGTYDVPSSAPYSAFNRGFIVSEVVQQQGVASSTDAAAAAKAVAQSRNIFEHVTITCAPDPRINIWDTIDYLGDRWLVQGYSITLTPAGPMTITARRVYT